MLTVHVPVATVSELNRRDHWAERHRRSKQQKELTTLLLRTARPSAPLVAPYRVKLVRIAPGAIRDSDNLAAATKAVRDAVAAFLGVDDADVMGNGDVRWSVAQERGPYGLRVEIESCREPEAQVG